MFVQFMVVQSLENFPELVVVVKDILYERQPGMRHLKFVPKYWYWAEHAEDYSFAISLDGLVIRRIWGAPTAEIHEFEGSATITLAQCFAQREQSRVRKDSLQSSVAGVPELRLWQTWTGFSLGVPVDPDEIVALFSPYAQRTSGSLPRHAAQVWLYSHSQHSPYEIQVLSDGEVVMGGPVWAAEAAQTARDFVQLLQRMGMSTVAVNDFKIKILDMETRLDFPVDVQELARSDATITVSPHRNDCADKTYIFRCAGGIVRVYPTGSVLVSAKTIAGALSAWEETFPRVLPHCLKDHG